MDLSTSMSASSFWEVTAPDTHDTQMVVGLAVVQVDRRHA